jgi:hypothetical protein
MACLPYLIRVGRSPRHDPGRQAHPATDGSGQPANSANKRLLTTLNNSLAVAHNSGRGRATEAHRLFAATANSGLVLIMELTYEPGCRLPVLIRNVWCLTVPRSRWSGRPTASQSPACLRLRPGPAAQIASVAFQPHSSRISASANRIACSAARMTSILSQSDIDRHDAIAST